MASPSSDELTPQSGHHASSSSSSPSKDSNMAGKLQNAASLTIQVLQEITDNFSEERKIGQGGYGTVYKGVHANGEEIAVKLLYNDMQGTDDRQFKREFENLTRLEHRNVVRLVGYCYETQHKPMMHEGETIFAEEINRALCFEYMCNGSLQNHISEECDGLDWYTRYNIIKGICEGVKYLHEGFREPIYHMDLKPANILLDENMMPKLADFGLSKFYDDEQSMITQNVIGTIGYLPPEYLFQRVVSKKLDIFSLGVVMTKIMTGPRGLSIRAEMTYQEFIRQVHENWRKRLQETCLSQALEAYCEQVNICIEIALDCMDTDRHKRPNIVDIIHKLNKNETMIEELKNEQGPTWWTRSVSSHGWSNQTTKNADAAEDDPLPGIEGLGITGEPFPGRELEVYGYSINGTTICNFEWLCHMEDGTVQLINGANNPTYLVTADDVDTLLAIEVQPLDDRNRKGYIWKLYANEQRKIRCDPQTEKLIKLTLSVGHASYEVLLTSVCPRLKEFCYNFLMSYNLETVTLQDTGLETWEPAVLVVKREGYSIKCNGQRGVVATETFEQYPDINIPFGSPTEFSIQAACGVDYSLKPAENSPSRDTIVLVLRMFAMQAVEKSFRRRRGIFFEESEVE